MQRAFILKFLAAINSNLVVLNKEQTKFFRPDFDKEECFSLTFDGFSLKFHGFHANDGTFFSLVSMTNFKFDVFGKIENFNLAGTLTLDGHDCTFIVIDENPSSL